jgi:hypothetical protein
LVGTLVGLFVGVIFFVGVEVVVGVCGPWSKVFPPQRKSVGPQHFVALISAYHHLRSEMFKTTGIQLPQARPWKQVLSYFLTIGHDTGD